MAEPFVGEIRLVGFNFAPRGFAFCNGQLLSISQNTALFSLLGTFYGGDGRSTFGLPNLQGAFPMHMGQGPGLTDRVIGETGGTATVTLTVQTMPAHIHNAECQTGGGNTDNPANAKWAMAHTGKAPVLAYTDKTTGLATMNPAALGAAGGNQPHNNLHPYLVMNFIIALQGIFPSRN